MGIIDFSPLDSEGIRLDRAASEVKWRKLTNCAFLDGALINRPGLKEFRDISDMDLPQVEVMPIIGIAQVENPGSSITGREGWTIATETIYPTGNTEIVASWTGAYTDIDEVIQAAADPATDVMTTSTLGAQESITFGNPTVTFETIQGMTIRGQAMAANTKGGSIATLELYQRVSSTNYLLGSVAIAGSGIESESGDIFWQNFELSAPLNIQSSCAWTQADLDALNIVIEYSDTTPQNHLEYQVSGGDGAFTSWFQLSTASTAAAYTDFQVISSIYNNQTADTTGIYTDTDGAQQSWTMPAALTNTFTVINFIELDFLFNTYDSASIHGFRVFFRTGGVVYYLPQEGTYEDTGASTFTYTSIRNRSQRPYTLKSTLNPATAAAWVDADIESGEFGIEMVGTARVVLYSHSMRIDGSISGLNQLYLNTLNVEIHGTTGSTPGAGLRASRLMVSNAAELRIDADIPDPTQLEGLDITDVTNSATLSTSPSSVPLDHATLYGQVYFVNGVNPTIRYPNGSNVFEALSTNNADGSTPITGRTIASFGGRILYGWVKDNATVTPERVAYSKIFDGGTHVDAAGTAGDFDLIDTPGGVVNLTPLNEDLCFAGKEEGIYALRLSGRSEFPLFRDVIDFSTRCLSITGSQRIHNAQGKPIVMFLGWSPTSGYNVFAFDGSAVIAVGDPIALALRDDANHSQLRFAFTGIEPLTGSYWLAFAEGNNVDVTSGYSFKIKTGAWTRFEFPFPIHSFGTWAVPKLNGICNVATDFIWGEPTMVVGTYLPMLADTAWGADSQGNGSAPGLLGQLATTTATRDRDLFGTKGSSASSSGRKLVAVQSTLETGDIDLTNQEDVFNTVSYLWHLEYEDLGPFQLRLSSSEDGGKTWNTSTTYYLGGTIANRNRIVSETLDVGVRNAYRTRFRFQIYPDDVRAAGDQPWKINKLKLEYQVGGDGV